MDTQPKRYIFHLQCGHETRRDFGPAGTLAAPCHTCGRSGVPITSWTDTVIRTTYTVTPQEDLCTVCGINKADGHQHGTWRDDDAPYTNGCEGHADDDATLTSGVGIGEVTYCNGSCDPKTEPAPEHTGGCEWLPGGIHINRRRPGEIDD